MYAAREEGVYTKPSSRALFCQRAVLRFAAHAGTGNGDAAQISFPPVKYNWPIYLFTAVLHNWKNTYICRRKRLIVNTHNGMYMDSLKSGYAVPARESATKRYCQVLELVDDPEKIARYRKWHETENIWKEIPEGLRRIGVVDMEIYISGNMLFMIVETVADFDWDEAFSLLATLPRQAEWEDMVGVFQKSAPGARSDEKWRLMERMFKLP